MVRTGRRGWEEVERVCSDHETCTLYLQLFTAVHTGHRFTVTGKKARHSMARKQPVLGPSPVTEVPEGPGYLWSTAVVDGRRRRMT